MFSNKTKNSTWVLGIQVNNLMIIKIFLVAIFFWVIPSFVSAQVVINEIMYDLEGSDTGREWVEVYNNGSNSVDLAVWKFYEAQSNHKLKTIQGDGSLQPGQYAIIADNTDKFLIDWPNFSGSLFDSSFSLKNTGEIIVLRDSNLADIDQVSYLPEWGAKGDGNSLQLANGQWVADIPTPGKINTGSTSSNSQNNNSTTSSPPSNNPVVNSWPVENQIFAEAGENKIAIVGADTLFKGQALGLKKEPLQKARYLWNLGDGTYREGQKILHTYYYPGDYVVFLDVSSGKYSTTDRLSVKAVPAKIIVSAHGLKNDSFIELENQSQYELNLSYWILGVASNKFIIPENTIISAKKKLILAPQATGFKILENQKVSLFYPNGGLVNIYKSPQKIIKNSIQKPTQTLITQVGKKNTKNTPIPTFEKKKTNQFKNEKSLTIKNEASVANSLRINPNKDYSIYKWLLFLLTIILISLGGIMFIRKRKIPQIPLLEKSREVDIDEIKIIEEK